MSETRATPAFDVAGIPDLRERILHAAHHLLGVDYDGTLAPFQVDRMSAKPLPDACHLLQNIHGLRNSNVLILSGRSIHDLLELMGDPGIPMYGAHGYEWRDAAGETTFFPLNLLQRQGLEQAFQVSCKAGLATQLERKGTGVALHMRGTSNPVDLHARGLALWQPIARTHELDLRLFDGGIEIRARGRDKGIAFTEVLRRMPSGTLPIYIGDDETDEDVFRVLPGQGIGIKVGAGTPTLASGRVRDPGQVIEFLRLYLALLKQMSGE